MEQTSKEEQGWSGVLITHTKIAKGASHLIDLGADIVPAAESPDQAVLNYSRVEGQLSEGLSPPMLSQQTEYFLLEASLQEITALPVTTSLLERKLLIYKCESTAQQQRHNLQQG